MKRDREIIGIMAATGEGVIGNDGALVWDYPDELAHFKETIRNQGLIMGRKTYESTAKDLMSPSKTVVLSRTKDLCLPYAQGVTSLEECLAYVPSVLSEGEKMFMIGGAEIAHLFLKNGLLSSFLLTHIHKNYPGNERLTLSYFDTWPRRLVKRCEPYTIWELIRPSPPL
jgi:dihydrofolate reductase